MDVPTKTKGSEAPGPAAPDLEAPKLTDEQLREQDEAREARASQVEAVRTAAAVGAGELKGPLTPEAQASALDWFLSDEEVPMAYTLTVNIGPPDQTVEVPWTITAISSDTLKAARAAAREGNRSRRRGLAAAGGQPEVDELEMNSRIIVAGSLDPDLPAIAKARMDRARQTGMDVPDHPDPMVAPVQLLQNRLKHKPGLIDQLAIEILRISGYDDDDLREHQAGKA